jgi:hypothetical protein
MTLGIGATVVAVAEEVLTITAAEAVGIAVMAALIVP